MKALLTILCTVTLLVAVPASVEAEPCVESLWTEGKAVYVVVTECDGALDGVDPGSVRGEPVVIIEDSRFEIEETEQVQQRPVEKREGAMVQRERDRS